METMILITYIIGFLVIFICFILFTAFATYLFFELINKLMINRIRFMFLMGYATSKMSYEDNIVLVKLYKKYIKIK